MKRKALTHVNMTDLKNSNWFDADWTDFANFLLSDKVTCQLVLYVQGNGLSHDHERMFIDCLRQRENMVSIYYESEGMKYSNKITSKGYMSRLNNILFESRRDFDLFKYAVEKDRSSRKRYSSSSSSSSSSSYSSSSDSD